MVSLMTTLELPENLKNTHDPSKYGFLQSANLIVNDSFTINLKYIYIGYI